MPNKPATIIFKVIEIEIINANCISLNQSWTTKALIIANIKPFNIPMLNSLITVLKNLSNLNNRFKRIGVRKLVSLNEISNQSIPKITFEIEKLDNLKNFSNLISEKGNTNVKIVVKNNSKNLIFELSNKRKINPKILKSLKNEPYLKRINL